MSETKDEGLTLGEVAEADLYGAQHDWWQALYPNITKEEALSKLTQQQIILIERPGGRLTTHVVLTHNRRSFGDEMFYQRYQRVPGEGYYRMYRRKG